MKNAYFSSSQDHSRLEFGIHGDWTISNINAIEDALKAAHVPDGVKAVRFHCNGLNKIDTSGAWVLYKQYTAFQDLGLEGTFEGFKEDHFKIVQTILETPK